MQRVIHYIGMLLCWLLIHSSLYANDTSDSRVSHSSEIKALKLQVKESKIVYKSMQYVRESVSPNLLKLVRDAQTQESSVNFIVNLHDDSCESEIEARSNWNVSEKINLMKELRKEVQSDLMKRMNSIKPLLIRNYDPFNSMEVSVQNEEELLNLMRDPRVKSVRPIVELKPLLSESLPLIKHNLAQSQGYTGEGISVAVVDSGIDYLNGNFGSCAIPVSTANPNCSVIVDMDFGVIDGAGGDSLSDHGTRVAATVLGVAGDVNIIGLDVFEDSGPDALAPSSTIMQALQWVATNASTYNIAAVNLSLGGGLFSGNCDSDFSAGFDAGIFSTLQTLGVVPVVASGNDGVKTQISSPACYSDAVSVGAVSDTTLSAAGFIFNYDAVDSYSNSSSELDLLAPGSLIAVPGLIGSAFGTSFAAPHVSGASALLRASNAFPDETVQQTIDRLATSGDLITDTIGGKITPRINVARALELIDSPDITYPLTGTTLASANETVSWDAMGTVPQYWAVLVGSNGLGSYDVHHSGVLSGSSTSNAVSFPTDGREVTVGLYAFINGAWNTMDSEVVNTFMAPPPAAPEITSPLTGTTLTSSSVTVSWDAMGTVPQYWAVLVGSNGLGSYDVHHSGVLSGSSTSNAVSFPTDGREVTVGLYAFINGAWNTMDSEVVNTFMAPPPAAPEITSPLTGTTLTSSSVTVSWDAMGTVPQYWAVLVGSNGLGSYDVHHSGVLSGSSTSNAVSFPTDGREVTVGLYAFINGAWNTMDSEVVNTFMAPPPAAPEITSPLTGTTLTSSSVTVSWDAMGTVPQYWAVLVGSNGLGSYDVHHSGVLSGSSTSNAVSFPTDGREVTVGLYAFINGAWNTMDSEVVNTFMAPPPAAPEITSPLTGTTLTSSSVTVSWDAMGTVPQYWAVLVGSNGLGSYDVHHSGVLSGSSTSNAVSFPTDGREVTVGLYAFINGAWNTMDSEVVNTFMAPPPAAPEITSPLTGTTLTSSSVTVSWDAMGTVPQYWAVLVGSNGLGSYDVHHSGVLSGSSTSNAVSFPTDGREVTVGLYAFINGAWNTMDSEVVTTSN
ncbi:MAG: S8 family serine peptidase [Gammaproteobacteria bacterium]|nr:S8 family serine peptidase [Gammaproteobacteria bacterium]